MRGKPTLPRRFWTDQEDAIVRELYPDHQVVDIAKRLNRTSRAVLFRAARMKLRKSDAWNASKWSGRIRQGERRSEATQYVQGQPAWNKGTRFFPGGRCAETQFKPGNLPHTTLPVGSYRIRKDGYLEQKYREAPGSPSMRWRSVHRLVWEAANGSMPEGFLVAFLPGMRTASPEEVTLDRLELVSRAEMMRRNTLHRYPPEIVSAIQLVGLIKRRIREKEEA